MTFPLINDLEAVEIDRQGFLLLYNRDGAVHGQYFYLQFSRTPDMDPEHSAGLPFNYKNCTYNYFHLTGAQPGEDIYCRVRCGDGLGHFGDWSDILHVKTVGYIIEGFLVNDSTLDSMMGVSIDLFRDSGKVSTDMTDLDGHFLFYNMPSGTYTLVPDQNHAVTACNSIDALFVMQHFVGMKELKGLALKAADVNGDGVVNSQDALEIQRKFIGQIQDFQAGRWTYDEGTIILNQDLFVMLHGRSIGDVTP